MTQVERFGVTTRSHVSSFLCETALLLGSRSRQWQKSCSSPAGSWTSTGDWTGLLFLTVLAFPWPRKLPRGGHSLLFPGEHLVTVSRERREAKRGEEGRQRHTAVTPVQQVLGGLHFLPLSPFQLTATTGLARLRLLSKWCSLAAT